MAGASSMHHAARVHPEQAGSPARYVPLSQAQRGLWMLQWSIPGTTGYNVPICLQVSGNLDLTLFKLACRYTIAMHPLLGAAVDTRGGMPRLRVAPGCAARFHHDRWEGADAEAVSSYMRRKAKERFALGEPDAGLLRIHVLSRSNVEHVVLLLTHHIIFDGACIPILCETLLDCYDALARYRTPRIEPARCGFEEFVAWESQMLRSPSAARYRTYWQQQLAKPPAVLRLPCDHPRTPTPASGHTVACDLPGDITARLRQWTHAQRVRPAAVFLAVYKRLLHEGTAETDITVGTPFRGRIEPRFEGVIGTFVNILPVRTTVSPSEPFVHFARRVQSRLIEAIENAAYPFSNMVRDLNPSRSSSSAAVFQVAYVYQSLHACEPRSLDRSDLTVRLLDDFHQEGEYELVLEIVERQSTFRIRAKHDARLYERPRIERWLARYVELLAALTSDTGGAERAHFE